jgi:hypothetical protein
MAATEPPESVPTDQTAGSTTDSQTAAKQTAEQVPDRSQPEATLERGRVHPSFYWTWRLLNDGYTPAECEQIRRLNASEILSHALQARESRLPVRAEWFLQAEQLAALRQVVGDQPVPTIRPLLAHLPDSIQYAHVQLYLLCR